MKIGIYSPYLDTAGGGEKYILTIAESLSTKHQVDVLIGTHLYSKNINQIIEKIKLLHKLDLSQVSFIKAPIGKSSSFLKRIFFLKKYDFLFYLTDGSFFYTTAKKNIVHFQVPFKNANQNLWNNLKSSSWDLAIYNSKFTQNIVEQSFKVKGKVIYPPINTSEIKPKQKKKQILSVGRFFGFLKDKKHKLLIDAFKDLYQKQKILKDWRLHLVGGASEGDNNYLADLKKEAKGYPIYLHPNLPYKDLADLYETSSIYWHAAGFGEEDPVKMEHFGISTVEAMARGCVPIVVRKGGLVEIVEDKVDGLFWDNLGQLKSNTLELIRNPDEMEKMAKKGVARSKFFSKEKFAQAILEIINE